MPDRLLYTLPFPESAQEDIRQQIRRQLAIQGTIQTDTGEANPISVDPNEQRVVGSVKGLYANVIANGIEELFGASGIDVVPYFGQTDQTVTDGYYALDNTEARRPIPQSDGIYRIDGRVRRQGTKRTHFRAVRVAPTSRTNPFGSATTENIGIPSTATRVQWWDQDGGQLEATTVQSTNQGEQGDLDIHDATEPSFASNETYHLIYNVEYGEEWRTDPRVWDDYNRVKEDQADQSGDTVGSAVVGTATVASTPNWTVPSTWQRVYRTDHEFQGSPVIENHVLRLKPDESDEELRAYTWNDADGHYDSIQLGTSSWRLIEFDLRRIGTERIDFIAEWEDKDNLGTTYHLTGSLKRGYQNVLFYEPAVESGSTPADLVTRLDPIAHDSDQDPNGTGTIVKRTEVKTQ